MVGSSVEVLFILDGIIASFIKTPGAMVNVRYHAASDVTSPCCAMLGVTKFRTLFAGRRRWSTPFAACNTVALSSKCADAPPGTANPSLQLGRRTQNWTSSREQSGRRPRYSRGGRNSVKRLLLSLLMGFLGYCCSGVARPWFSEGCVGSSGCYLGFSFWAVR